MAFKKAAFICPYCFGKHKLTTARFRCTNRRCKDVDDVEMTRYENGDINKPKQGKPCFSATSKNPFSIPKSSECPECKHKTFKIVCPSCHNTLPESTLLGRDMIISVVGSRDTGKSHFVGVIIRELIDRISVKFDGAMIAFDDSMKRYELNFGQRLYVDLQKLDLTQSSEQNVNNGAYKPLIFTLNMKNKGLFSESIDSFTFVFFDTAGEDLNEIDTMSTVNKYICKSAGIIFLLDPMQIPAIVNQLDEKTVKRASSVGWRHATRSDDIMSRVSMLIRNDKKMSSSQKISTPVAAVFSKFDAIVSIVPHDCPVLDISPHCDAGALVMSDWHNVNTEIKNLLKAWGASSFIQQLEINYTNYSYFAASSLGLGNSPRSDSHIERPRPHRIEDALLWILMENKVIKSKK